MMDKNIKIIDGTENIFHIKKILKKIKIKSSSKLAVLSSNCPGFALLVKACWEMGVVIVPVNIKFRPKKIHSILEDLGCSKIIVGSGQDYQDDPSIRSYTLEEIAKLKDIGPSILNMGKIQKPEDKFSNIMFSSGTLNDYPKMILHTLYNHYYSAMGSDQNISFGPDDTWLVDLPMYHISGFAIIMRSLLRGGNMGFALKEMPILESVTALGITHLSMVPAILYRQLENKKNIISLRRLSALLLGGGPLPFKMVEEAVSLKLPIFNSYGSTEMSSQISTTIPVDSRGHLKTSGKVLKYREVKISSGGEILARGRTLFKGYLKMGRLASPFDKDGWFRTGDLGYFDGDGYLYIKGRKDTMFISGGENIYPEEIENELLKIDGVSSSLIVPFEDREFGDIPVAFIKAGQKKEINIKYLQEFLNRSLEHYKVPKYFLKWPGEDQGGIKQSRNKFKEIARKQLRTKQLPS